MPAARQATATRATKTKRIDREAVAVHLSPCGRGRIASKDAIRVRGISPPGKLFFAPADRTPHPALRATFSHKGRRNGTAKRALHRVRDTR
jgi:hypothetical protein